MVHYDPPIFVAAQIPPPVCPRCGSHRTVIVGRSDNGETIVLRCNACGARSGKSRPTATPPASSPPISCRRRFSRWCARHDNHAAWANCRRRATWRLSAPAPPVWRPPSSRAARTARDPSCCSTARASRARRSWSAAARAATSPTSTSTERDFWGGTPADHPPRAARASRRPTPSRSSASIGVALHEEADGKLFPDTNRARDVLDALLRETAALGATLVAGHRVLDVERTRRLNPRRRLSRRDRSRRDDARPRSCSRPAACRCQRAAATAPASRSPRGSATPSCRRRRRSTPLLLDRERSACTRALSGVSQDVELAVWVDGAVAIRLAGSLLWTHFGVSGPVALNASRHWLRAQLEGRAVAITSNFRPGDCRSTRWMPSWQRARAAHPKSVGADDARRRCCRRRWRRRSCASSRIDGDRHARAPRARRSPPARRARWSSGRCRWPARAATPTPRRRPAASRSPKSIRRRWQSRDLPGLFLVGEMLDVDGRIGGFNFQWAWSSGFVAGRALARV